MERYIEFVYLLYFGSHIFFAIFFDSQAIFPDWFFPQQLKDVVKSYTRDYGDSMVAEPPAWYQSFLVCEMLFIVPFSFAAIYAYWNGVSNNKWIRTPMIIYSTHVITAEFCIYHHIFLHDFSKDELPGPQNMRARLVLAMFYFPYFILPIILLFDSLFSSVYKYEVVAYQTARLSGKKIQ
ncbi:sigma intracellular receptor 2-like [Ruditapes philippinarum]|uniref:sigma intracellular receptor 2-like n=1 Tax=Ruditapes philippinarum TaxID=129788 RepID=UPI00295B88E3|nr:sigma intracellular receptor 2-like [Ruditapes philippinarum]